MPATEDEIIMTAETIGNQSRAPQPFFYGRNKVFMSAVSSIGNPHGFFAVCVRDDTAADDSYIIYVLDNVGGTVFTCPSPAQVLAMEFRADGLWFLRADFVVQYFTRGVGGTECMKTFQLDIPEDQATPALHRMASCSGTSVLVPVEGGCYVNLFGNGLYMLGL